MSVQQMVVSVVHEQQQQQHSAAARIYRCQPLALSQRAIHTGSTLAFGPLSNSPNLAVMSLQQLNFGSDVSAAIVSSSDAHPMHARPHACICSVSLPHLATRSSRQ
jgi:hypothetical protein